MGNTSINLIIYYTVYDDDKLPLLWTGQVYALEHLVIFNCETKLTKYAS